MKTNHALLAALTATLLFANAGTPAGAASHGEELPEICTAGAMAMDHTAPSTGMSTTMETDQPHPELMMGMEAMNADMMTAMSAPDIDVAFVCGMIPHHRGAIAMARVELMQGDNQWAKDLAQKVIDAQEQEIAEMLVWLEEQASQ